MYSLNRAQIVGNVTRDPEMRFTPNGQAVCSFGVATNRRWKDKDGNTQEQTEFHNVVAWRKLAELMSQLVHKGNKIYLEGRMQTRSWEGQDGGKRNRTEIVMDDFILLTPKGAVSAPAVDEDVAPTSDESESRPRSVGKEFPSPKEEVKASPRLASPGLEKPTETKTPPKKSAKSEEKPKEDSIEGSEEINLDDIPF